MKKLDIVTALSALAQISRLEILEFLMQAGPAGRPAGQIADSLGIPAATLSFHLKTLRQARLIECQRHGRLLVYRVDTKRVSVLLDALCRRCGQDDQAGGNDEGCQSHHPLASAAHAVGHG